MKRKLGVVMDDIHSIQYEKDSTLAMLWEASRRDYEIYYFEQTDLFVLNGFSYGHAKLLQVHHDENKWFSFHGELNMPLADLDIILMRKDPPIGAAFLHTVQVLEYAERAGVIVVNRPSALLSCNEKIFACDFPECAPPTLVSASREKFLAFWHEFRDVICKPLDTMGGESVFRVRADDVNANVIYETLTAYGTNYMMVQKFIPEIKHGDKRILMINGEPVQHLLARIPQPGDWRGNLAAGAKGVVQPLSERDQFIAKTVGPVLRERGIYFAGLDVIGDYLTEINITSPTCIREIEAFSQEKISMKLFDCLEAKLK